jgi:plasmid stability protein
VAQILVRNLDDSVVEQLKERARKYGCSLQSEVKRILEQEANAPRLDMKSARKLVRKIRRRFVGRDFPDSVALIREDRDR